MLAHKGADQIVGGVLQHLLGGGHLDDFSGGHEDDDVRQLQRLAHVVADEDDGLVQLLLQVLHLVLQGLASQGIESGEGLIHQHDGGRSRQGPQHADALLLAAGELRRILVGRLLHVDQLQHLLDDLIAPGLVVLQQLGDHADVLGHGHVGEQADLLDHIADMPPQFHLVLGVDILPVDADGAGIGLQQAVDHLHGGGLAAAGRADQDHELSVWNGEIQVLEDRGLAIALGDVFKLDHIAAFTPLSLLAGGRPLRRWGFPPG